MCDVLNAIINEKEEFLFVKYAFFALVLRIDLLFNRDFYRTRSRFIYYYYEMKGILNLYPFIVVYFSCFYEVQIRISKEEEVIFENKFFQGNKKIINSFLHKST